MDQNAGLRETIGVHRRRLLKAVAQAHPAAAALVELWSEYVPTRREQRQADFIARLAERIDEMRARLDASRILTEPYADVFEDVMASVSTRRGLEKAPHYVAALVNGLRADAPEWDRQERMREVLDALRPSHLWILGLVMRHVRENPGTSASVVGTRTSVRIRLPDNSDPDLVDRDWRDMVGFGLFKGLTRYGTVGPGPQTSAVELQGEAVYFHGTIQPFGVEFSTFVEAEAALRSDE